MGGFEKIDEETLVNFALQLVIEDGGRDYELGGTQFINLFHDSDLTRENVWQEVERDVEEIKKISSNPSVIADILANTEKAVFRSEKRQQIWQLSLSPREAGEVFEWVFDIDLSRRDELAKKIEGVLPKGEDPKKVTREILSSLGGLSCWQDVNKRRFGSVRIVLPNVDKITVTGATFPNSFRAIAAGE